MKKALFFLIPLCCFWLTACDKTSKETLPQLAEDIPNGAECHLCGMAIDRFSGPKGQAFGHGQAHSVKFCSTIDLFSWALQPENKAKISKMYVHNMDQDHWDDPQNNPFIDAKTAWYVWGHHRKGAMGKTLGSFSNQATASDFAKKYGGKVYAYKELSLDLLKP